MKQNVKRALWTGFTGMLLLVALAGAILRRPPPTQPLRPAPTVVLLLAPGLSEQDVRDSASLPTGGLARLFGGSPHGVFTTRSAADSGPSANPLRLEARMLATGNLKPEQNVPTLAGVLRRAGVTLVPLTNSDPVLDDLVGQPVPDPLAVDQPVWRSPRYDFPDGWVTEPRPFVQAILSAAGQAPVAGVAARPAAPLTATDGGAAAFSAPPPPVAGAPLFVLAHFSDLDRADAYAPLALPAATAAQRRDSLLRLDATVAALTSAVSSGSATAAPDLRIVVLGALPSPEARARGERLGPIAIWSPTDGAVKAPLLTSPSTRSTPGLIAGTDVAATLLALLDLPTPRQPVGAGRAARTTPDDGKLSSRIAGWDAQARAQSLLIYVPWALAVLAIAAAALGKRSRTQPAIAVGVALFPLTLIWSGAFGLSPEGIYPAAALPSLLAALSVLLAPRLARKLRPILGAIALLTVATIVLDTVTGGNLLARTPLSYSVMEGARFYGIGNEAAGILVGAGLIGAALLFAGDPVPLCLLGAAIAITLGAPQLGAKFGSLIGVFVGFGALVVLTRKRGTRRGAALWVGGVFLAFVIALGALALVEGTRTPDAQTHIGRAISGERAGGIGTLAAIAKRKLSMDFYLLHTSPWAALLAVEVVLALIGLSASEGGSPDRRSFASRSALRALLAGALALLLFNDAGVVGAACCLIFSTVLFDPPASA